MNRDNRLRQIPEKLPGKLAIIRGQKNSFSEIDNFNPQLFDRSRQLLGGVAVFFGDLRGPAKQIFNTASAKIVSKDSIRIIQIANDQIKAREIAYQFWWQLRI